MDTPNPIIDIHGLEKTFAIGRNSINALRGIDLKIYQHDFVAILGPSGSGKSTLLHLIGALDRPSKGQIIIAGNDTSKMGKNRLAELRQNIGFVFQYYNLVPRLTAFQNVELAVAIQGKVRSRERKTQALSLLEDVGLFDRIHHKNAELSGGQQQRVAIARALAQKPAFLLMDEPTGNVDTKTRDSLLGLIQEIHRKQNLTIVIVTHDLEVARHCNRVIHLVDGHIVQDIPNIPRNQRLMADEPLIQTEEV